MFKLKLLNAALAVALGLGFGIATAQTDQAAQHGNALDKPSNKADQQAVGIPAKPGAQSGQTAQRNLGRSEQSAQQGGRSFESMEQVAQLGTVPSSGGDVYGWRPTEALSAPQSGPRFELGDQLAQLTVYGWRPGEAMSTQLSGRSLEPKEQIAQRDESKTTGQGQGVRESGGQAGVKTPAQSGNSPADHFAQSGSAPDAGSQGTTGGA